MVECQETIATENMLHSPAPQKKKGAKLNDKTNQRRMHIFRYGNMTPRGEEKKIRWERRPRKT